MARLAVGHLEWASASRPLSAGDESGDACLVRTGGLGTLVAVVDGLGHGPEAGAAARTALALLAGAEDGLWLEALQRCHIGLKTTRGAVLSLAWFDANTPTMGWVGVGNVQGVLARAAPDANPRQEPLLVRGGVLGRQLPAFHASVLSLRPGDTLVFATDGIAPAFAASLTAEQSPRRAAERALAEHWTGLDDGLVLVARYRGED